MMKIKSVFMEPLLIEAKENQKQYFELLKILSEDNEVFFQYLNDDQINYFKKNEMFFENKNDMDNFDILFIFGGRMKTEEEVDEEIQNKKGIYFDLLKIINDKDNFIIANYLYDPKVYNIDNFYCLKNKNIKFVFFNAYNYQNQKSLNLFEYFCFRGYKENIDKEISFCFGFTASPMTERKYLSDYVKNNIIENDDVQVFCKDKFINRNNLIDQTEYLEKIKKSKYSLIAPSNDKKAFSFSRLLECLSVNCIPLIFKDCNLEILKENYFDIFDFFISNNLIIDYNENINQKIKKLDFIDLVQKMNSLESIKLFKRTKEMKDQIKISFKEGVNNV